MSDCNKIIKLFLATRTVRIKTKKELLYNDGGGAKSIAFNIQDISNEELYSIFDIDNDEARNTSIKSIKDKLKHGKFVNQFTRYITKANVMYSGKSGNVLVSKIKELSESQKPEDLGSTVRATGIAMYHIVRAYKSELDIINSKNITQNEKDELISNLTNADGVRVLNSVNLYAAIGRQIMISIGYKASGASAVSNNLFYTRVGKKAVETLSELGIVNVYEKVNVLNNDFTNEFGEKLSYDNFIEADGISLNLDIFEDKKNIDELYNAINSGDFSSSSIGKFKTFNSTFNAVKAINELTSPVNEELPRPVDIIEESDKDKFNKLFFTNRLGNVDGRQSLGVPYTVSSIFTNKRLGLSRRKTIIHPMYDSLFLTLSNLYSKKKENGESYTLDELFSMIGIRTNEHKHAIFGSYKHTIDAKKSSNMGKSISTENPLLQLIENYDIYKNSEEFLHEFMMYGTSRVMQTSTILNEQSEKHISRQIVTGGEQTVSFGSGEFVNMIESILDSFYKNGDSNSVIEIINSNVNNDLDNLLDVFENLIIRVENKTDEQKAKNMAAMLKIFSDKRFKNKDGKVVNIDFKYKSPFEAIDHIRAIYDIRNRDKSGTIKTYYRTKPDATGSGVVLTLLQSLGLKSDDDVSINDMLYRLDISKKDGKNASEDELFEDVYDVLVKALIKEDKEQKEVDALDEETTIDMMKRFTDIGIFKSMRDIVKPITMVTNYESSANAAIKSSSDELADDVINFLLNAYSLDKDTRQKALNLIGSIIKDINEEFYIENNISDLIKISDNNLNPEVKLADIDNFHTVISDYFSKDDGISVRLRMTLDRELGSVSRNYKDKLLSMYKYIETSSNKIKSIYGLNSNIFTFNVIPALTWIHITDPMVENGIVTNREHFLYEEDENGSPIGKNKSIDKSSKEYLKWYTKKIKKYGMPLTSKKQAIVTVEEKDGYKTNVNILKETPNSLTSIVNTIHSIDAAILIQSHKDTTDYMVDYIKKNKNNSKKKSIVKQYRKSLEMASGMIHDANNADPVYNSIYEKFYRANTFIINKKYDVHEQLSLLYASIPTLLKDVEINGKKVSSDDIASAVFDPKLAKELLAESNRKILSKKASIEKNIVSHKDKLYNYKIFGFKDNLEINELNKYKDGTKYGNTRNTTRDNASHVHTNSNTVVSSSINDDGRKNNTNNREDRKKYSKNNKKIKELYHALKLQGYSDSKFPPTGFGNDKFFTNYGGYKNKNAAFTVEHSKHIVDTIKSGSKFVVFDIENTYSTDEKQYEYGEDGSDKEILEIYAEEFEYKDGKIVSTGKKYSKKFKPTNPESYDSIITDEYKDSSFFGSDVYTKDKAVSAVNDMFDTFILDSNSKIPFIAYNGFKSDFKIFNELDISIKNKIAENVDAMDSMYLSYYALRNIKNPIRKAGNREYVGRKQTDVAELLGITIDDSHTANSDVSTMVKILEKITNDDIVNNDYVDTSIDIISILNKFSDNEIISWFKDTFDESNIVLDDSFKYIPKEHAIHIDKMLTFDASFEEKLSHEIIHYATIGYIYSDKSNKDNNIKYILSSAKRIKKDKKKIISNIRKSNSKIKDKSIKRIEYIASIEDDNELISELVAILIGEPTVANDIYESINNTYNIKSRLKKAVVQLWNNIKNTIKKATNKDIEQVNNDGISSDILKLAANGVVASGIRFNKNYKIVAKNTRKNIDKSFNYSKDNFAEYMKYYSKGSNIDLDSVFDDMMFALDKKASTALSISANYAIKNFGSPTIGYIHEYLYSNIDIYKDKYDRITDYWDRADWIQSLKGYIMSFDRFADYMTINKMITLADMAAQSRKQFEDNNIAKMNRMLKKYTKEEHNDITTLFADTPIYFTIESGSLKNILKDFNKLDDEISRYEFILRNSKSKIEKINKLAKIKLKIEEPDKTNDIYTIHDLYPKSEEEELIYGTLLSLYMIKYNDKAKETINKLNNDKELLIELINVSKATKEIYDNVYNNTGDNIVHSDSLMYHGFEEQKEIVVVTVAELNSNKYTSESGWKILREPSVNGYAIVYRDADDKNFQQGIGVNIKYLDNDLIVPRNKRKGNKTKSVIIKRSGYEVEKVIFTRNEEIKLGVIRNPADVLYRAYGRMMEIQDTQKIRDEITNGSLTHTLDSDIAVTTFDSDLSRMNTEDRPMFIRIDVDSTSKEILENNEYIGKYYKVVQNITSIGDLKNKIHLVRKDYSDIVVGSEDVIEFENNSTLKKAAYAIKQLVKLTKIHMVITNIPKIIGDMTSNVAILTAYGVPLSKIPSMFKNSIEDINKIEQYRLELLDLTYRKYKGEKVDSKIKAKLNQIKNSNAAPLLFNGMMQSISIETLSRDESVISGIQKDTEDIINMIIRNGDGDYNSFAKALKTFFNYGYGIEDILSFAGKSAKNIELLSKFGKGLEDSADRIKYNKTDGELEKYISEFVASPDSTLVRFGSSLVQTIDIASRKILYDTLINRGEKESEAIKKSLEAFIDYKVNQPKEIKFLSDYGILLFPSFWLRSQKVIYSVLKNSPINSMISIYISNNNDEFVDNIFNSNIIYKAFGKNLNGDGFEFIHEPPIGIDTFIPADLIGF